MRAVVLVAIAVASVLLPTSVRTAEAVNVDAFHAALEGRPTEQSPRASRPPIVSDPLPAMPQRQRAMAAYSFRHYGKAQWRLEAPKQIVIHFTAGGTYRSAWWTMASPSLGSNANREQPQPFAHFAISQSGIIYQLAPLSMRARHAVGLNSTSIGIEFVEPRSAANILNRPRQLAAGIALVRWLQARYGISTQDVIGHAMANQSRYFVDLTGRRNSHTDWTLRHVLRFRALLALAP